MDSQFGQGGFAVQERRRAVEQLLIEVLANDLPSHGVDPHGINLSKNVTLAKWPSPERHVTEFEMKRVSDIDAVVRRCRATIDHITRAGSPGTGRVHHQEGTPNRFVDHRAG